MNDDIWLMLIFIIYKLVCLSVGLFFSYMGYRLFMEDKIEVAGEIDAKSGKHKFKLTKAAPGTLFALFGAAVITVTIFKGVEYHINGDDDKAIPIISDILPDKPPF